MKDMDKNKNSTDDSLKDCKRDNYLKYLKHQV